MAALFSRSLTMPRLRSRLRMRNRRERAVRWGKVWGRRSKRVFEGVAKGARRRPRRRMKCVFIKPPAPLHHIFLICVLYAFTTRQHTVVQQFYIFHLAFVPLRQIFQQNLWVCFNSLHPPPLVLLRLSTQFYISCGVANSNKFYETNPP